MSDLQPQVMRRPEGAALVIALGLAAVAGVMLWDSARLAEMGGYSGVGPASAPRRVSLVLLALALCTVISAFRGDFPQAPPQSVGPVVWIIAGLALQLILLKWAGFSIASGVLFALTARAFGKTNLAINLAIGIAVAFGVWVVFSQLLMLHLPAGPLEHLVFSKG